ncbi:MAG TPA: FecR domain-containing protein [Dinghuibacter sp.]|uniref:FecR family protein n=1 Tax=Dinghuibacter sp. TaxID=2024697 RepID=UPI002CD89ECC|nr:FecR domain-containing protein [Dinghuibacter sp.]HTJ13366.1 FecR domain-containing protein [Dinghuibacter sp.]
MHIDDLAALLKRYHEDQCTPEERRIIEEWYEGLSTAESIPDEAEISASLERVLDRVQPQAAEPARQQAEPGQERPAQTRHARWPWYAAAASVLLIAGIYALTPRTRPTPAIETLCVTTAAAEVRQITLPDGSAVTLNANTTLSYEKNFAQRRVHLEGEAFFQVAPDPGKPFIADVRNTTVTVLGTSFDIRAYERDTVTKVALLTGRVRVGETTLNPGEIARKGSNGLRVGRIDSDVTAWEQKAIDFRDASFEDIAFALQNTYNVRLVNASHKKRWSYTGYFQHESVWEIVRTICITEHLDYRSDQGQIILVNKN